MKIPKKGNLIIITLLLGIVLLSCIICHYYYDKMINKEKFYNTGSLPIGTYYIESKKYPGKFLIIPQSDGDYYSIVREGSDTNYTYHIDTKEEKLGFLELKIGQHDKSTVQITESSSKHINFYIENTSDSVRNKTQTIYLLDNNTLTITNSDNKVLDGGKYGFTYQTNSDGSYVFKVKDYAKMVTNPTTTASAASQTATERATQIPIELPEGLNKYLSMDASNVPYYPVTNTKSHLGKVSIVDYITDSEKFYFYNVNHFPVVSFLFEKVNNYYYQNDEKYNRINKPKLYISNVVQGDELKLYNDSVGKLEIFYLDLVDKSHGLKVNYNNDIVKIAQNNKYWSIDKKGFIRCNTTKKNGTSFKLSEYDDNTNDVRPTVASADYKRQYYLQDINTGNFLTINPEGELLMSYDHYKESKKTQDNIDKRVILNLEPVQNKAILDMHDYADTEMEIINDNIRNCINETFKYLIYPRHYTRQEILEEHHVKQSKTEFLFDPERAYCFKKNITNSEGLSVTQYLSYYTTQEQQKQEKKAAAEAAKEAAKAEAEAQAKIQSRQQAVDIANRDLTAGLGNIEAEITLTELEQTEKAVDDIDSIVFDTESELSATIENAISDIKKTKIVTVKYQIRYFENAKTLVKLAIDVSKFAAAAVHTFKTAATSTDAAVVDAAAISAADAATDATDAADAAISASAAASAAESDYIDTVNKLKNILNSAHELARATYITINAGDDTAFDTAKNTATSAIQVANKVLTDANEYTDKLINDNTFTSSKQSASEDIKKFITDIESKVGSLSDALTKLSESITKAPTTTAATVAAPTEAAADAATDPTTLTNEYRFRIVQDEFGFFMFESLHYRESKNVKGKYFKHKNDILMGFEDYKSYDTDKNTLKTFKFDIKVRDTSDDIYTYDIYTVDFDDNTKRYKRKSIINNLEQINILPVSYEIYKYKPVDTTDNNLLQEQRISSVTGLNEQEQLYIYKGISLNVNFSGQNDSSTKEKEFNHIDFFPRFKPEIYEGMRITGEDNSEFIGSLYKEHHKPLSLSKLIPENTKICVNPNMTIQFQIKSNKINNYYKKTTNLQGHYELRTRQTNNNFTCKDIQKLNLLRLIEVDGNYIITSSTDLKYKKSVYKCPCDCFDTDVLDADKGLRKLNRFTKQGLNGVLNSVDGILSERTKDMTEIRTVVDGLLNRPLNTQFEIYETNNLIDTNPYSNKDEVDNYYREKAMEGYQNMFDDYDFDTMFNKDVIDLFKGEYKIFPGQFILLEDCKLVIDSNYVSINKYDYPIIKFQYNSTKRIESPYKNFLAIQFTIVNTDNRISDYETRQIIKLLETLGLKTPNYIYISKHGVQLDNDNMQIHYKFSDRQYSTLFQMYKIK